MVRLKASVTCSEVSASIFQFHYGTIKSKEKVIILDNSTKFQFHYGTIKSGRRSLLSVSLEYFNSTMVRLKGINEAIAQSEMKFQFHYGTIKSTISQSCSGSALLYFNSTMVRLKVSCLAVA